MTEEEKKMLRVIRNVLLIAAVFNVTLFFLYGGNSNRPTHIDNGVALGLALGITGLIVFLYTKIAHKYL